MWGPLEGGPILTLSVGAAAGEAGLILALETSLLLLGLLALAGHFGVFYLFLLNHFLVSILILLCFTLNLKL